jgi:hypothetical protein
MGTIESQGLLIEKPMIHRMIDVPDGFSMNNSEVQDLSALFLLLF